MIRLTRSGQTWWQKPLAQVAGCPIPAELAILELSLQPGEQGAWLNSRGKRSGVRELQQDETGVFATKRIPLPNFVRSVLDSLYSSTGLVKGCPDLIIWHSGTRKVRLIEVKCPHWDRPSEEQLAFLIAADRLGIETTIVEWEFDESSSAKQKLTVE